ncbi:hypothetical protein PVAG01_06640 [Phlyctema vagabunda]|uniref:Uncharacterized protein n=1 Tax=Phlyctema vagabunda TaxID=108571 RepID=A0ABR4PGQ0_9HELO
MIFQLSASARLLADMFQRFNPTLLNPLASASCPSSRVDAISLSLGMEGAGL